MSDPVSDQHQQMSENLTEFDGEEIATAIRMAAPRTTIEDRVTFLEKAADLVNGIEHVFNSKLNSQAEELAALSDRCDKIQEQILLQQTSSRREQLDQHEQRHESLRHRMPEQPEVARAKTKWKYNLFTCVLWLLPVLVAVKLSSDTSKAMSNLNPSSTVILESKLSEVIRDYDRLKKELSDLSDSHEKALSIITVHVDEKLHPLENRVASFVDKLTEVSRDHDRLTQELGDLSQSQENAKMLTEDVYEKLQHLENQIVKSIDKSQCSVSWSDAASCDQWPPPLAFSVGTTRVVGATRDVFIARAHLNGGLFPGTLLSGDRKASFSYNDSEEEVNNFQVLVSAVGCLSWTPYVSDAGSAEDGAVPGNAIPGGFDPVTAEEYYIGRVTEANGQIRVGRVMASRGSCFVASGDGLENEHHKFDILIRNF